MKDVLSKYQAATENNRLLFLDFVALSDYLFKLKSGTRILARLQERVMYYLAAAVSDFFIPSEKMVRNGMDTTGHHSPFLFFFFK